MNRSLSLEQEKIHWANEYKFLCKKKEGVSILKHLLYENQIFILLS